MSKRLALLRPALRSAAQGLFFLVLACALTWPLAAAANDQLPLGTEQAATVPLFNLWTLWWNAARLQAGYSGYWDAPIFYPERGTFALADPQPLSGLLYAPGHFLTGNPVLAYNLLLLLTLALNGYTARRMLRRLGLERGPALLGGVLAEALPFVSNEIGVLQLTALYPLFLSLAALHDFAQTPNVRPALALGGWAAAAYLTSGYYGVYLSLFVLLGGLVFVRRDHLRWRSVASLLAGTLLSGSLLLPVVAAQLQVTSDYQRATSTLLRNSAQLVDFVRLDPQAWGHRALPWLRAVGGSGQRLYPGTGLLLAAAAGIFWGWRAGRRRWVVYCAAGACLAALLSLGLRAGIGDLQPYGLLRQYYPGVAQLRSPFRMAVFVQVFLVGLAGYGLAAAYRWRGVLGRALAVAFVGISLLEVLALPARLYPVAPSVRRADWVAWLRDQPSGAVAMVPFAAGGRTADFEPTVVSMLQSLEHGHPLVNGYAGYFPPSYWRLKSALRGLPDRDSLAQLRDAGASYAVVDPDWLTPDRQQQLAESMPAFRGEAKWIFRLEVATQPDPARARPR